MRTILNTIGLLILVTFAVFVSFHVFKNISTTTRNPSFGKTVLPENESAAKSYTKWRNERLLKISSGLQTFAKNKGYNSDIAFLVDMNIPSGENRFFVYNMQKDSIEAQGLVTHGYGSPKAEIEFSNVPGSNCTSLGKYKIGTAYNGRFGLAYKLHGLDKTNDKAFERFVVLHSHSCVPEAEVAPLSICESQGCPTVSPLFLQKLKSYISSSSKPILLTIYK